MGQFLATRAGGVVADKGFDIQVIDDGIGMTPQQVQDFFLVVGAERRNDPNRGSLSPGFKRKVMGRKGVGKLAPFGICKTIEVISAGGDLVNGNDGDPNAQGYLTSHIVLDYDGIVALGDEPDERYEPTVGEQDDSLSPESGTRIILKSFNYRKVPDVGVLGRQLAQRFGIRSPDWEVELLDNTQCDAAPQVVGDFNIDTMENTRITFQEGGTVLGPDGNPETGLSAGFEHDGTFHPLVGWMAYSRAPYSDELMAGVRIYCRKKIAAQTSIFNQRAGFTGEHNIRSYLVGELHADWLDEDEDLIQTDRRDILWSDELAASFQEWGQGIVKRIGTLSRDPLRKATLELFLETGNVEERILHAYPADHQEGIRDNARDMARSFGRTISRGEAEDPEAVVELVDLSITLAPHITLNSMMKEAAADADRPLSVEWAPVTENRTFSSLRKEFEKYYEEKTGVPISLSDFEQTGKRPDFVLSSQEGTVQIIEIKKPHHTLTNPEMDRIVTYYQNMDAFLSDSAHSDFSKHFPDFHVTVVCDDLGLTGTQRAAFDGYRDTGKLTHLDWAAFLLKTEQVHQDFLREAERQRSAAPQPASRVEICSTASASSTPWCRPMPRRCTRARARNTRRW